MTFRRFEYGPRVKCECCGVVIERETPRVHQMESMSNWCVVCADVLDDPSGTTHRWIRRTDKVIQKDASASASTSSSAVVGTMSSSVVDSASSSSRGSRGEIGDYTKIVVEAYKRVQDELQSKAITVPSADVIASLAATAAIQYFRKKEG